MDIATLLIGSGSLVGLVCLKWLLASSDTRADEMEKRLEKLESSENVKRNDVVFGAKKCQ